MRGLLLRPNGWIWMLGNAEIGHDTQYFPQNGFSVSGKPPAGKLDRDAEYRYFYGQIRWRRNHRAGGESRADCGQFEQISDRIVRRHGETGSIFAPAAVRLRPCLRRCPNAIGLLKKPWWQESFRGFIIMSDRNLNFWQTLRFVALSLALSHGERGSGFSKSESRRIGNQMSGKPENVQARQPNSLSLWERARERVSKPQACLFSERYESVIRTRFGFWKSRGAKGAGDSLWGALCFRLWLLLLFYILLQQ